MFTSPEATTSLHKVLWTHTAKLFLLERRLELRLCGVVNGFSNGAVKITVFQDVMTCSVVKIDKDIC